MAVPVEYSHVNFHKTLTQTLRYRYSLLNIEFLETILSSFLLLATVTKNFVLDVGKCLGCNSPFRHVTNHAFLTWIFFTPFWKTILNSMKKTNKRTWNKNLKMPSFWQYLTVQIVLTERKTSLITVFPKMLKIMAKKAWNFRKWEGKSG